MCYSYDACDCIGAAVDYSEHSGYTALMKHTERQANELVQELIRHKANVDIQNNAGKISNYLVRSH